VRDYFDVLRWIAAGIIIVMGLHFLGVIRIGILYRQLRADAGDTSSVSLAGAYVIGLAFAFGWTPCVGPFFIGPFMRWMTRFRKHLGLIEKIMGAMLILFGLLIATNSMNYIAQWMLSVGPDIGVLR